MKISVIPDPDLIIRNFRPDDWAGSKANALLNHYFHIPKDLSTGAHDKLDLKFIKLLNLRTGR